MFQKFKMVPQNSIEAIIDRWSILDWTHALCQGSQTGISRAACGPSICSVRPATKIKIRKCPKMTRFLDYFRKMRPLNTYFGLYAARETICYQNVALEDIWVWDLCLMPLLLNGCIFDVEEKGLLESAKSMSTWVIIIVRQLGLTVWSLTKSKQKWKEKSTPFKFQISFFCHPSKKTLFTFFYFQRKHYSFWASQVQTRLWSRSSKSRWRK